MLKTALVLLLATATAVYADSASSVDPTDKPPATTTTTTKAPPTTTTTTKAPPATTELIGDGYTRDQMCEMATDENYAIEDRPFIYEDVVYDKLAALPMDYEFEYPASHSWVNFIDTLTMHFNGWDITMGPNPYPIVNETILQKLERGWFCVGVDHNLLLPQFLERYCVTEQPACVSKAKDAITHGIIRCNWSEQCCGFSHLEDNCNDNGPP